MDVPTEEPTGTPAPEETPLTHHTAHGFAWMLGQTAVTKVTGFLGQVVIARFLGLSDFGVIGIAFAVASFPAILRDAGLQSILVQRQRHLNRWIHAVFWLSLALGTLTAVIICGISPLVAHFFQDRRLVPLLCIIGFGAIINALGTAPMALVQIRLMFRFQAIMALMTALLTTALSILMAWRGCGAYSVVAPIVFVNGVRTVSLWIATHYPIRWKLYLRRWRFVFSDSGTILLFQLLYMAIANGDYLILGARYPHDKDVVGGFYFAYNLSWQALTLLTVNMAGVLFPALSRLAADPPRQTQAYLRSARVLALIGVPACFLQTALAGPGMHLLFKGVWDPTIPIVQVLSLAMAIRVVGMTYFNFASSQGRFKLQLVTNSITCVAFLLIVSLAAWHGRGLAVATAEAIFFAVTDPLWLWVALRTNVNNALAEVARIFVPPVAAAAVAVGIAFAAASRLPSGKMGDVLQMCLICGLSAAIYVPLIRLIAREPWQELMDLARRLIKRPRLAEPA